MAVTTEQVWDAFHAPLQGFIRKRVHNQIDAEDVLQEVFLKIHTRIETLQDVKKLESWVYQITRNAIIDAYRGSRADREIELEAALELPVELPDDDIVSELFPCVQAMVRNLPAVDRQAIVLTEYQGVTQREFGKRLGLSLSGAKSRVQRAREKLKQQLLACCHFELDRRGHIIDYQAHCACCVSDSCCHSDTSSRWVRPSERSSVSSDSNGSELLVQVLNVTRERN